MSRSQRLVASLLQLQSLLGLVPLVPVGLR